MTGAVTRFLVTLAAVAALVPSSLTTAWGADLPKTYLDSAYGDTLDVLPTSYEQQDKMWFHDDAWWALMYDPDVGGSRVFELLADHTWRPTEAVVNDDPSDVGDALRDGESVYVVSRTRAGQLQFRRLDYDPLDRRYTPAAQEPTPITNQGGRAAASIAKDTTGRLWVSFATNSEVLVSLSDDDGATWTAPFEPVAPGGATVPPGQVSAVVAFGTSIGVMWSDQEQNEFRFAIHPDGAALDDWSAEIPLAGPGLADNHISIKAVGSGADAVLLAAVKTSQGDHGEPDSSPLIMVLKRAPGGSWTNAVGSTLGEGMDSPTLQIDSANDIVYLLSYGRGAVYAKTSPIGDLSFPPGRGTPYAVVGRARLADPTGSKHPVDGNTGLVVLGSGTASHRYSHSELALPGGPSTGAATADSDPPTVPGEVLARADEAGMVVVSWSAANDGDRWSPANDGVPVAGYVVYRDGVELGRTDRTSYADADAAAGTGYEYSVRAVDRAGNLSAEGTATVAVPAPRRSDRGWAWILLGVIAAVVAGLLLARRRPVRADASPTGTHRLSIVNGAGHLAREEGPRSSRDA